MSGPSASSVSVCDDSDSEYESFSEGASTRTRSTIQPQTKSRSMNGGGRFSSQSIGHFGESARVGFWTDFHPVSFGSQVYRTNPSVWINRPKPQPVHERFQCDGCQMTPIVGDRYHCMHPSCGNYDLCGSCKARGNCHPSSHDLARAQNPPI